MNNKLKLYSVADGYINYLQMIHKHVYSNKEDTRVHSRKYIGVVLLVNNYKYFIPLSSPKEDDYYIDDDGNKKIRKDSFLIWYIVSGSGENQELRGSIRIANMIPVPSSELIDYNINNELDEKYKTLVQEEEEYLRKRQKALTKRVEIVYKNKINKNSSPVYNYCLDYTDLERMHDEWLKNVSNSYNN